LEWVRVRNFWKKHEKTKKSNQNGGSGSDKRSLSEHLSNESIADTNFQDHPQDAPQLNHFRQETMLHNARVAYVTAAALVPGCPRKNLADQLQPPKE